MTHVYELVRAYGTRPQVEFSGSLHTWERTPAIADKHRQEEAVRPSDGTLVRGPSHAPLVMAADPRTDAPAAFQARLIEELDGVDERVVGGWLAAPHLAETIP